jgi:YbbR domain-containing protein
MILFLRKLLKGMPTLLFALILAFTAWVAAVNSSDPSEMKLYSQPVSIHTLGQDPKMVIQGDVTTSVTVVLNAPKSSWTLLNSNGSLIKAFIDLSGLTEGTYQVPVQVQVDARPMQIASVSPQTVTVTLDRLTSKTFPVSLVTTGEPEIGYETGTAVLSPEGITISGPASQVKEISQVRATISLLQAKENIKATLPVQAVDLSGDPIEGLTYSPKSISADIPLKQKGGYRNVVVTVITQGKLADGYRLSNITVNPPTVTVYSSDPTKVEALPGYVETQPINLDSLRSDINMPVDLSLPEGVSLVGQQQVAIQIGINAIQSSISFTKLNVVVENLSTGLSAQISPDTVDVILSGPLPVLDKIKAENIQVVLDLKDKLPGTYQLTPVVITNSDEVNVESVLPGTVEVVVQSGTPTPKP